MSPMDYGFVHLALWSTCSEAARIQHHGQRPRRERAPLFCNESRALAVDARFFRTEKAITVEYVIPICEVDCPSEFDLTFIEPIRYRL